MRALAVIVTVGVLAGCGGESTVPEPCRVPFAATLDGELLPLDGAFGYQQGSWEGVAWFAGEVYPDDGSSGTRAPTCADAASGGVGATTRIRVEATDGTYGISYDLPLPASGASFNPDGHACNGDKPCMRARVIRGPRSRPGQLDRCVDATLYVEGGEPRGKLHLLRLYGRFEAQDCGTRR